MSFRLPVICDAADYVVHFNDEVWQRAAATICARQGLSYTSLRRSPQGENIIFFGDEDFVIKIFAPFRENYLRETEALAFAQGKLSIKTPDLMHTGEIDGWSYLVMTRLAGQASREVWARVGPCDRLEIVSRLGLAISELHKYAAPLQTGLDRDWRGFIERQARMSIDRQRACGQILSGWQVCPHTLKRGLRGYRQTTSLCFSTATSMPVIFCLCKRADAGKLAA